MYIVIGIIALIIDQVTKSYAINHLKDKEMLEIIPKWLYLTYVENKGAAFGFLNSRPMFFTIFASIFVLAMIIILFINRNNFDSIYKLASVMIIVGALGNLIDRFRYGFVVDFIFSPLGGLYDFPVFNFADIYLTLTAIALAIYMTFFQVDEDVIK